MVRRKFSYKDSVFNLHQRDVIMEDGALEEEDDVSDDDGVREDEEGLWLHGGMSKAEKKAARDQWRYSVIVKLVEKGSAIISYSTGYRACGDFNPPAC